MKSDSWHVHTVSTLNTQVTAGSSVRLQFIRVGRHGGSSKTLLLTPHLCSGKERERAAAAPLPVS